jgi:alanine or glycine:cation symporter, AGCS family
VLDAVERAAQALAETVNAVLGPAANFLAGYLWNWPPQVPLLAALLLGTGLFVTLRLVFIQVRGFRHAVNITRGVYDDPKDEGDLNHFQALTTALSATVGIGNIAGVAIAIRMGGPGALFWMWVTAFFGMALKYAECTLGLAYRKINADGSVSGGPMYYIEKGLGPRWKPVAVFFAACAMISSFGSGNMNQSNTMADQVSAQFGIHPVWTAIAASTFVALVIIGGIKRIGRVTSILAPSMAVLYVAGALVILGINFHQIPSGFALIFQQAFAPEALVGGGAGSFLMTLMWGVRRGLFSNEAGQGSAPIAHATAKTKEPVREGLVASLEPFIDTLVICTMTGLVIVMTGAWAEKHEQTLALNGIEAVLADRPGDGDLQALWDARGPGPDRVVEVVDGRPQGVAFVHLRAVVEDAELVAAAGRSWNGSLAVSAQTGAVRVVAGEGTPSVRGRALLTGAPLTALGFRHGLPGQWGNLIVTLAVLLFAVSTAISWSYYGDRATEYLFGAGALQTYRWVFVSFFFMGAILPLEAVWTYGDVALGMMAVPNLLALVLLSGVVVRLSSDYFSREQPRPDR